MTRFESPGSGPYPARSGKAWDASESIDIETSSEAVWALLSQPGHLTLFHTFCADNPCKDWEHVGCEDAIHYFSGLVMTRQILNWSPPQGFDVLLSHQGTPTHKVAWRMASKDEGAQTVEITIRPLIATQADTPDVQQSYTAKLVPAHKAYLRATLKGLKHYLETGKTPARNAFGAQRYYSPEVA